MLEAAGYTIRSETIKEVKPAPPQRRRMLLSLFVEEKRLRASRGDLELQWILGVF